MSEITTAPTEELFSNDELRQFEADDVEAGGAIGKMLALFFLYTVVVMAGVAWWTFNNAFGVADTAPAAAHADH